MNPHEKCITLAILAGGAGFADGAAQGRALVGGVPIPGLPAGTIRLARPDAAGHRAGPRAPPAWEAIWSGGERSGSRARTVARRADGDRSDARRRRSSWRRWTCRESTGACWIGSCINLMRTRRGGGDVRAAAGRNVEPFPCLMRRGSEGMIRARFAAGERSMRWGTADMFLAMRCPADWASDTWTNLNDPDDLVAGTPFTHDDRTSSVHRPGSGSQVLLRPVAPSLNP